MNAVDVPCPRCRAPAGTKCRNYRGQNKQSCPERSGGKQKAAKGDVKPQAGKGLFEE